MVGPSLCSEYASESGRKSARDSSDYPLEDTSDDDVCIKIALSSKIDSVASMAHLYEFLA